MVVFEGYEKWFDSYTITKKGRYVVFSVADTIPFNLVEDIEDTFNITFVSCIGGKSIVFSINYDD